MLAKLERTRTGQQRFEYDKAHRIASESLEENQEEYYEYGYIL